MNSNVIGSEAVDWMINNMGVASREEAVALGQMLMYRGIIRHVNNSEPFLDKYYFYRFAEVYFAYPFCQALFTFLHTHNS